MSISDHSRVTPAGRALGERLALVADKAAAALEAEGEPDERCKSCAFRLGTVPNGCLQTQLDAMKATIEDVPFLCHQNDRKGCPCHGWFAVRVAIDRRQRHGIPLEVSKCPWDFSPPDEVIR